MDLQVGEERIKGLNASKEWVSQPSGEGGGGNINEGRLRKCDEGDTRPKEVQAEH